VTQQALAAKINDLRDELIKSGVNIPFALKRRDPNEPGRIEKESLEDKIFALFMKQFRKQRKLIKDLLGRIGLQRMKTTAEDVNFLMGFLSGDFYLDPEMIAQLSRLLTKATKNGVELFGDSNVLQMDYTLTNTRAATWANKYSFELIKGINKTTTKSLRNIFGSFIDTPGMTIGNVMDLLPFDESRSLMIATTEITRAYATAAQMAGEDLAKEFPGVRVIKQWWTNNDDRVCPICGPLHGVVVDVDESFDSIVGAISQPPAHVFCRCWMNTTTRIVEQPDIARPTPLPPEGIVYEAGADRSLGGVNESYRVGIGDEQYIMKPGANIWELEMESEVFANQLSDELGFGIVPNTSMLESGTYKLPDGSIANVNASLQQWVENGTLGTDVDWDNLDERSYSQMTLMDSLTNNRDRHSGNWLIVNNQVVAIDNGLGLRNMTGDFFHHSTFINSHENWLDGTGRDVLKFEAEDIDAITNLTADAEFRSSFVDTFGQDKWNSFEYQANVFGKNKGALVSGIDFDFMMEDL
jgi:hypothetical protein